jgi:predicted component of viral defense system (DUF524 family)
LLKLRGKASDQNTECVLEIIGDQKDAEDYLVEATNYDFKIVFPDIEARNDFKLEPSELFILSRVQMSGECFGRFLPGENVGEVLASLKYVDSTNSLREIRFEKFTIKSKKLNYETEYKQMLSDVAERSAEALLSGGFIASDQFVFDLEQGELDLTALSYLAAKLESSEFRNALATIRARPDHRWQEDIIEVPPGRGSVVGPRLMRALVGTGRKIPKPEHLSHLPVNFLPHRIPRINAQIDFDSVANRFIRYVLLTWQNFARSKIQELEASIDDKVSRPTVRAIDKLKIVEQVCGAALIQEPLRSAGRLTSFPQANTVLTSRPGYRDIFRMFLRYRLQVKIALPDSVEPFSVSKRDVANLYEMWCFLEVMNCLDTILGTADQRALFRANDKKFQLNLVSGEDSKVEWQGVCFGREVKVCLWYNKKFQNSLFGKTGSWTNEYKPDISLQVSLKKPLGELEDFYSDVWVHFDAKYKLEVDSNEPEAEEQAKKDDLSKMHTYRDAIRRTAGAYVLYPGSQTESFRQFQEILPGLGAFPFRPADQSTEEDRSNLGVFLKSVIEHCCNQATTRERLQFWQNKYLASDLEENSESKIIRASEYLVQPPADTPVLIGYVRPENVDFVRRNNIYNLRADSERAGAISPTDLMLNARFLVLWTGESNSQAQVLGLFERTSNWFISDATELEKRGYKRSIDGSRYFACDLTEKICRMPKLEIEQLSEINFGTPMLSNWSAIFSESRASLDSWQSFSVGVNPG